MRTHTPSRWALDLILLLLGATPIMFLTLLLTRHLSLALGIGLLAGLGGVAAQRLWIGWKERQPLSTRWDVSLNQIHTNHSLSDFHYQTILLRAASNPNLYILQAIHLLTVIWRLLVVIALAFPILLFWALLAFMATTEATVAQFMVALQTMPNGSLPPSLTVLSYLTAAVTLMGTLCALVLNPQRFGWINAFDHAVMDDIRLKLGLVATEHLHIQQRRPTPDTQYQPTVQ